jgi:PilZ domain
VTDGSPDGTERRNHPRADMALPVRVQGREPDGQIWEESTTTEVASAGGLGFSLKRAARPGQVLHVSLPLPKRLRKYDLADPSYTSYVLVRDAAPDAAGGTRVGTMFLGKSPPRGEEPLATDETRGET